MHERPWHQRTLELESTEYHWADYAAWLEWFDRYMEKHETLIEPHAFEEGQTRIALYCMCCDLVDGLTAKGSASC